MSLTKQQLAAVDETISIFNHIWKERHRVSTDVQVVSQLTQAVIANLSRQQQTEIIYRVPEVAKLLKVNAGTVYHLVETKQLKAMRIESAEGQRGTIRITKESLETYLRSLETITPAAEEFTHLRIRRPRTASPAPGAA